MTTAVDRGGWCCAVGGLMRESARLPPHPICALFQHGRDRSGVECRIGPIALHLFPRHIMAIGLAVGLVEVLVGTVAGAWLYREEPA